MTTVSGKPMYYPQYQYPTVAPPKASPKKAAPTYYLQKKSVLNPNVVAILNKLTPWDPKGYISHAVNAASEEAAVGYFTDVLQEDEFGTMIQNGRHLLGTSEQSVLIAFFAQMADKYPQYNLCAAVTSIIAQLG